MKPMTASPEAPSTTSLNRFVSDSKYMGRPQDGRGAAGRAVMDGEGDETPLDYRIPLSGPAPKVAPTRFNPFIPHGKMAREHRIGKHLRGRLLRRRRDAPPGPAVRGPRVRRGAPAVRPDDRPRGPRAALRGCLGEALGAHPRGAGPVLRAPGGCQGILARAPRRHDVRGGWRPAPPGGRVRGDLRGLPEPVPVHGLR